MKNALSALLAVLVLAHAHNVNSGLSAGSGIAGSVHDLSVHPDVKPDAAGRLCVYCHTPHHAVASPSDSTTTPLPLWNRTLPETQQYTPYTWPASPTDDSNLNQALDQIVDPLIGPTRLCLSCHDGMTAIDAHGGAMGTTGSVQIGSLRDGFDEVGRGNLTYDLNRTHPTGIDYVEAASMANGRPMEVDQRLHGQNWGRLANPNQGYAISIDSGYDATESGHYNRVERSKSGVTIADNLYEGRYLTCVTCHDPHNKDNAIQDNFSDGAPRRVYDTVVYAPNYFLRAKVKESLICLSCHLK